MACVSTDSLRQIDRPIFEIMLASCHDVDVARDVRPVSASRGSAALRVCQLALAQLLEVHSGSGLPPSLRVAVASGRLLEARAARSHGELPLRPSCRLVRFAGPLRRIRALVITIRTEVASPAANTLGCR